MNETRSSETASLQVNIAEDYNNTQIETKRGVRQEVIKTLYIFFVPFVEET